MSDSDQSETKKESDASDTSSDFAGYQFFDATKDYSFSSFSSQPTVREPAPPAISDASISPDIAPVPAVVEGATATPVAPPTPPSIPITIVRATPAPTPAEPAKKAHLSFGPNFNFSRSIVRVFNALDIDLSNRLSRKELDDGLTSNKLHGDEYLLALTLLDYYDEIHKNVFGTGGADMGASIEEILTYVGVKPSEIKEVRGMKQSVRRGSRNSWSRD